MCGIGGFTFLFGDFIQSPEIWLLFWTGAGAVFGLFFGGITGAIRVRILQLSNRPLIFSHVSVYVISCTLIGLRVGYIFERYSPYGPFESVLGAFFGAVVGFTIGGILGRKSELFELGG